MLTAADDDRERLRLAVALMAACWERGADLAASAVVRDVADVAGCAGTALVAQAGTDAVKARLAAATAHAAAAGVFGMPTFRIDGQADLFWGGDRIDALLWQLAGGAIDEPALDAFLARPPAAVRRQ